MFLQINDIDRNIYMIASIVKDGKTIIYKMINGTQLQETFDTEQEATALFKYIKTKFLRTMLGVLKVTQDNKKSVWKYVPLQDFTENSDIDWTKSVAEIDKQLYAKYGLTDEEIFFIETNVKEMK